MSNLRNSVTSKKKIAQYIRPVVLTLKKEMNSNYSITDFNFDLSHLRKTKILKLSFVSKQVNTFPFVFYIQELKRHESTFTSINDTQVISLKISHTIVSKTDLPSKLL